MTDRRNLRRRKSDVIETAVAELRAAATVYDPAAPMIPSSSDPQLWATVQFRRRFWTVVGPQGQAISTHDSRERAESVVVEAGLELRPFNAFADTFGADAL